MAHPLAEAHRRIAAAEHGVEESIKRIASRIHLRSGLVQDADELSRRADDHLRAADRIDRRASED
jgi:hypothetical protein